MNLEGVGAVGLPNIYLLVPSLPFSYVNALLFQIFENKVVHSITDKGVV